MKAKVKQVKNKHEGKPKESEKSKNRAPAIKDGQTKESKSLTKTTEDREVESKNQNTIIKTQEKMPEELNSTDSSIDVF